jgi:hypothetical protein
MDMVGGAVTPTGASVPHALGPHRGTATLALLPLLLRELTHTRLNSLVDRRLVEFLRRKYYKMLVMAQFIGGMAK